MKVANYCGFVFFLQYSQILYPMTLQRKHFIVYIYILKLIISFNLKNIYNIIDIGQFVAPNRKAIEEAKLNVCQLLIF